MESKDKLKVLQDVFEVDWNEVEQDVNADLVRFTKAVVRGDKYTWYDDDPFIEALLDNFNDEDPLWQYIALD